MGQIPIYCSVNFLQTLFEQISHPKSEDQDADYSTTLAQLHQFFQKNALLNTDRDLLELVKENRYFLTLVRSASGRIRTKPLDFERAQSGDFDFYSNQIEPQTIFFLDDTCTKCKDIEDKYGFMAFSYENLGHTEFLFSRPTEVFVKNEIKPWSFLLNYAHPYNALILSDPYILCEQAGRDNLKEFLVRFLPKKLSISFDLTIIADRDKKGLPSNLQAIHDEIYLFLVDKIPYPVNVSIILAKGHDRNVLTNYVLCSSGYGFELIKDNKSDRNTHLTFLPITSSGAAKGYKGAATIGQHDGSLLFSAIKKRFKKVCLTTAEQTGLLKNTTGNKQNRLLGSTVR